ncbi:MAG: flagellar basal body L-ring protein FlgH [Pseudomonadota bacterium]
MKRRNVSTQIALAILVCGFFSGCARLAAVGSEPEFSPAGASVAAPAVAPERVAITQYRASEAIAASMAPNIADAAPPPRSPSLWSARRASLLGDRRAQRRGDILTVVIEVDEEASISNATSRARSANEDLSVSALLGLPKLVQDTLGIDLNQAAQLSSGSGTSGDGSVQRSEKLTLRLAATVVDVLPNGHFAISGSQEIRVNYELRDLTVRGVVRPEDISRANEITYDKIADARVGYGGRGVISDVQQPRYGQQIADIILPF